MFAPQRVWSKYTFVKTFNEEDDKAWIDGVFELVEKNKKEKHKNSWVVKKGVGMEEAKNEKYLWKLL